MGLGPNLGWEQVWPQETENCGKGAQGKEEKKGKGKSHTDTMTHTHVRVCTHTHRRVF